MELTPKLLTDDVDFRIAFRGYDQDEVDDFLERVAEAVGQLLEQLNQAVDRARSAESRLQKAQLAAATTKPREDDAAEAATPAAAPLAEAPSAEERAAAKAEEADLNEELRRTLVLAQRTADTAIAEAREEAERIATEAAERAETLVSEADAEAQRRSEEAKGRLLTEVDELERVREAVRADVGLLERHLGEQRARVRETVQILRRVVEDSKSFELAAPPELSGATVARDEAESTPAVPSGAIPVPVPDPVETDADDAPAEEAVADTPADAAKPSVEAADPASDTPAGGTPAAGSSDGPAEGSGGPAARAIPVPPAPAGGQAPSSDGPSDEATPGPSAAQRSSDPTSSAPPAAPRATSEAPRLDLRHGGARPPAADAAEASARHDLRSLFGDSPAAASSSDKRPEVSGRRDQGPHTQPVAATRVEEEPDDAFLAELRKAMTEEEPLGPRDGIDAVPFAAPQPEPRTTRFGRRR